MNIKIKVESTHVIPERHFNYVNDHYTDESVKVYLFFSIYLVEAVIEWKFCLW